MKKLLSLMLVLAIVLTSAVALADLGSAKTADGGETRNIKIKPAGVNAFPTDGTSPTTGRKLADLMGLYQDGFDGMVVTGKYYPIMVQHCGICNGFDIGAPFYGSYADIYYELAKSQAGHTRMCMVFNDFLPKYAGASRSMRVGYIWLRQEWNAPLFYQGSQTTNWGPTDVDRAISELKLPWSGSKDVPWEEKVLFDGYAGSKQWLRFKYRIQNSGLVSECNLVWNLPAAKNELLGERSFDDHNHTLKFGELPEGGEDANNIYVIFNAKGAKQLDSGKSQTVGHEIYYYWNTLYQYEPEENVYYRYAIEDMENPENTNLVFEEHLVADEVIEATDNNGISGGMIMKSATLTKGEPITFSNVIVQYINMDWSYGGECPLPKLLGTGNADYFMGGKRYTGVWSREKYDDRTVFYGPDGEEITLQPGRTMIILMDYKTANRDVKFE